MRTIAYFVGGLVILVGSFLITNWILSRNDVPNWKFNDEASLDAAAKAAAYHKSNDLGGHVDSVIRLDAGNVRADGWAADITGDGAPVTLDIFAQGRDIAAFPTDGPRADVTASLKANPKASGSSSKNTKFTAGFACPTGEKLFVVASSPTKSYALLGPQPLLCP